MEWGSCWGGKCWLSSTLFSLSPSVVAVEHADSKADVCLHLQSFVSCRSARLLLYCVHLNNSSSESQRRACLSAAQSISQSCVVASSIPPLAVPSFCLRQFSSSSTPCRPKTFTDRV